MLRYRLAGQCFNGRENQTGIVRKTSLFFFSLCSRSLTKCAESNTYFNYLDFLI